MFNREQNSTRPSKNQKLLAVWTEARLGVHVAVQAGNVVGHVCDADSYFAEYHARKWLL